MNNTFDCVHIIILAAGGSSRFGSPKQLAKWNDVSLLEHAVDLARTVTENVLVVLGSQAEIIQNETNLNQTKVVINPDWQHGIASSICAGINNLPIKTKAAMILLCDQPLLKVSSLKDLISLHQQNPNRIIASEYAKTLGVPAIFPAVFFPQLCALSGDSGAKKLINAEQNKVISLPMREAVHDIDTPDNLEDLTNQKVNLRTLI